MKVKSTQLIAIVFFALVLQYLAVEHLEVQGFGHWQQTEYIRALKAINEPNEIQVVQSSAARPAIGAREDYGYIAVLWDCGRSAIPSCIPYFVYWYYFHFF